MYAVIGTAGHVDHGKSSLIHALTGIHPSHLPQEFERSMTIDLGFAYLNAPDGGKVGIIDVPGHERFIRNMVSSVWGLDMVLFIVAADEGWASLSEEHLRVIAAMGVKNCIVVLTKCDLVDEKRQDDIEEDVLERFLGTMDLLPDVIRVSAHTGQGIDALKLLIFNKIGSLQTREDLSADTHLYVDRVFSVAGIGTTVTGTLRGRQIHEDDVLTLFPGGQSVRVRSLQSYHEQLKDVPPYSRVAIGLKQVNKKLISRGSCLVANPREVTVSKDWIVQLNPRFSEMKKQSELEVALGTAHTQAQCYVFADGQLARLQLKESIPAFWGQPLLLIQHGGSRIIGAGRLVWMRSVDRKLRKALEQALPELEATSNDPTVKLRLELGLNGYAAIQPDISAPEGVQELGSWWVNNSCVDELAKQSNEILTSAINAVSLSELGRRTGYPTALVDVLVNQECEANRWQRIEGGVVSLQMRADGSLPADQVELLAQIQVAGTRGFLANPQKQPGIQRLLRALTERKHIVPTIDNMFFTTEIYNNLLQLIMRERVLGEEFGVADARDRTELGRKQLIPLLNRIEKDGWVRRVGDNRVVTKVFETDKAEMK